MHVFALYTKNLHVQKREEWQGTSHVLRMILKEKDLE